MKGTTIAGCVQIKFVVFVGYHHMYNGYHHMYANPVNLGGFVC